MYRRRGEQNTVPGLVEGSGLRADRQAGRETGSTGRQIDKQTARKARRWADRKSVV